MSANQYRPEYCDEVITFLADGYSLAAFAGHVGVSRQTLYNWMEANPAFAGAAKIAQAKAVLFWERANRTLAITGDGNATACVFALKNRAPDDWRDMKALEHSGPDGGPVETVGRIVWQPAE